MNSERSTRKSGLQMNERVGKWARAASAGHGRWMGRLRNEKGSMSRPDPELF